MLASRGFIDYNQPVANYWPEFAAHGKAAVTVAMLLSHQAGHIGFCGCNYARQWLAGFENHAFREPGGGTAWRRRASCAGREASTLVKPSFRYYE
ncbi:serine hydrolase domain-containing protein [Sphingopyxis indica]|uniref:serine hydrolase domain-containing protein n=1 Tax=Sphingopyxis indica TaxID=436663 RepID=UPI0029393737|nr:serine hydrolase domain-containing protein [Sphingopyxis indica]